MAKKRQSGPSGPSWTNPYQTRSQRQEHILNLLERPGLLPAGRELLRWILVTDRQGEFYVDADVIERVEVRRRRLAREESQ